MRLNLFTGDRGEVFLRWRANHIQNYVHLVKVYITHS